MFLPKRSLPICQWSRMPGLVDLVALVTNQVDRWPSSELTVARGLCACLVHPNNMGKGTTRSNRCEFIKRWAISGAQREVYFNLHTNCSHWFAQRAATTTTATATTTRKAEGIRQKAQGTRHKTAAAGVEVEVAVADRWPTTPCPLARWSLRVELPSACVPPYKRDNDDGWPFGLIGLVGLAAPARTIQNGRHFLAACAGAT